MPLPTVKAVAVLALEISDKDNVEADALETVETLVQKDAPVIVVVLVLEVQKK
jgi:hypothetical protein